MYACKYNSPNETLNRTYLVAERNHLWLKEKYFNIFNYTVANQESIIALYQGYIMYEISTFITVEGADLRHISHN